MHIDILGYRFTLVATIKKLVTVNGIDSIVDEKLNTHILLWDFDAVPLDDIIESLTIVQLKYILPRIRILQTKRGYHAYCFAERSYSETLRILSSTQYADDNHFKIGVMRGYWTLRITPKSKKDTGFKLVYVIESQVPENLNVLERLIMSKYKTHF